MGDFGLKCLSVTYICSNDNLGHRASYHSSVLSHRCLREFGQSTSMLRRWRLRDCFPLHVSTLKINYLLIATRKKRREWIISTRNDTRKDILKIWQPFVVLLTFQIVAINNSSCLFIEYPLSFFLFIKKSIHFFFFPIRFSFL